MNKTILFIFFVIHSLIVTNAFAQRVHSCGYQYSYDKDGVVRNKYEYYNKKEFPLSVCIDTDLIPETSALHKRVLLSMRLWNVVNKKRQNELLREGIVREDEFQKKLPPYDLFHYYNKNGCGGRFWWNRYHIKVKTKDFSDEDDPPLGRAHYRGKKRIVRIDQNTGFENVLWQHINPYSIVRKTASMNFSFWILAHEFGHTLGFPHFNGESIMRWGDKCEDTTHNYCKITNRVIDKFLSYYLPFHYISSFNGGTLTRKSTEMINRRSAYSLDPHDENECRYLVSGCKTLR